MKFKCARCKKTTDRRTGHVRRARKAGMNLYCGRRCAGLAKRRGKTRAQRVSEKSAYDKAYRASNLALIRAKKKAYFHRTYDPVKAAIERKANMPRHVKYCQRPEYRAWKSKYDKKYRAKKDYGAFAEVAMLVSDLNLEINQRTERHEIRYQNQGTNKAQRRRREGAKEPERGRNSRRSAAASIG